MGQCLDYLVCQYASRETVFNHNEKDVVSIILYNLMSNNFIERRLKQRLRSAAKFSREQGNCNIFKCEGVN